MKIIIGIWMGILSLISGYGIWATASNNIIDRAADEESLREDSVTGKRPLYFYKRLRGPRGGGLQFGK